MTNPLNPDPDLKKTLTFIQNMADLDDLSLIREAVVKRQRALVNSRASELLDEIAIGRRVQLVDNVKPKYLAGQVCEVLGFEAGKIQLKLMRGPQGKFKSGTLRAPMTLIEKVL